MVIQTCTLSEVGLSDIFKAVKPKVLSKPPQYKTSGLATVNSCALSAGSAPAIIKGGEATSPELNFSGPQGSVACVSVAAFEPDKNSSQSVVTWNRKETLLLSKEEVTPTRPFWSIKLFHKASSE